MTTLPLAELENGGQNAPIRPFTDLESSTRLAHGATRFQEPLNEDIPLDALVVNKGHDILVVALHGATDRNKTVLPRFEWLRTLLDFDVSSAYFSDPTLLLDVQLQLSWYTGWDGVDVQRIIADRIVRISAAVGAKKVVVVGSSGGGFAALQVSALIPDSVALAFNAQTAISEYRVNGTSWGVQRYYVRKVWPAVAASLEPANNVEAGTWEALVDDRVSAVRRYSTPRLNRIYIIQNEEEFHYEDHFLPFLDAARAAGNDVIAMTNREGVMHNPPRKATFIQTLGEVLEKESPTVNARA